MDLEATPDLGEPLEMFRLGDPPVPLARLETGQSLAVAISDRLAITQVVALPSGEPTATLTLAWLGHSSSDILDLYYHLGEGTPARPLYRRILPAAAATAAFAIAYFALLRALM